MPILESDKKLEAFINTIVAEAIDESHDIALELSLKEKEIIDKAREDVEEEVERYKKTKIAEIKAAESRRVSARMTENKHTLLQFREACAKEAFNDVRKKINEFTASDEYLPHLKGLLKKATDVLGYGFSAEVFLRREDMHFADALLESSYGVSLAFSEGSFTLGGLCLYCQTRGKRIDMTFDAALGDMVGHFAELTELRIEA